MGVWQRGHFFVFAATHSAAESVEQTQLIQKIVQALL
jgi:hypothetical protein